MSEQLTPEQLTAIWDEHKKIEETLKEHQKELREWHSYRNNAEGVKMLLATYRNKSEDSIQSMRHFRDDLLIWLRSVQMVIEMTGNAGTHREKDARLRGAVELVDSLISKLHDHDFSASWSRFYWRNDELFRTDYPVRQYLDRKHEAERKQAEAEERIVTITRAMSRLPESQQAEFQALINQVQAEDAEHKGRLEHEGSYIPF